MKNLITKFWLAVVALTLLSITVNTLSSTTTNITNYYQKPKIVIPAEHLWIFSESDLQVILVNYLKSIGTNVPNGIIKIKGLESHYDYSSNPRLELFVAEKNHPPKF